jgi:hypothetical protein
MLVNLTLPKPDTGEVHCTQQLLTTLLLTLAATASNTKLVRSSAEPSAPKRAQQHNSQQPHYQSAAS